LLIFSDREVEKSADRAGTRLLVRRVLSSHDYLSLLGHHEGYVERAA
jgi:hypothetical protein